MRCLKAKFELTIACTIIVISAVAVLQIQIFTFMAHIMNAIGPVNVTNKSHPIAADGPA